MEFECPHCGINMSSEDENAGEIVACPACNERLQIPNLAPTTTGPMTRKTNRSHRARVGWDEEDHANVNFLASLGLGVAITVVYMLLLVPFAGTGFSDLFLKRGWVNYAETFFFIWGMVILALKWKKTQRQQRAMLLEVLPSSLGAEINSETVPGFIDHIYKLPVQLRDSLMVNRIRKGLELFEKRNDNAEVSNILDAQSDIDANRIGGSYSLLKVFLWAIPIFGFIGTVQGLSVAVSSLSAGADDLEMLKESINKLTSGLGVVFDTTFLGLILSIILSFPMAAMQKHEEEMLTRIDAFCNEKLLTRLNDSKQEHAGLFSDSESIPAFAASLAKAHEDFLIHLQHATGLLSDAGETLRHRLDSHQTHVEGAFIKAVNRLTTETREAFVQPSIELNKYFATLNTGIESLNTTLKDLGGETIIVKKRGFFSR